MRLVVMITALLVAGSPARAEDRTKAEQLFLAGARAFKQQSFAAAADHFEAAYKAAPLPEIAFSAAQSYRRQFFIDPQPAYVQRAVELYKTYLAAVKKGGRVGDAADGLAEMQRELDKLQARGAKLDAPLVHKPETRLAISVGVAGEREAAVTELSALPTGETLAATAKLDGKPVELYVPIAVEPGDHVIEVTAPGYFPQTLQRRAVEGVTDLVDVELQPRPARLTIRTEDGAHVAVNGRSAGEAPLQPQELAAGTYTITITRRGREPVVRTVELTRAEERTLDVALAKTGRRKAVPWLAGTAAGLALLSGGATWLALRFDGQMADIDAKRTMLGITEGELADYEAATRRRDRARNGAWISGGAAIAVGATAALLYVFDVPSPSDTTTVVPLATQDSAGIGVLHRF